MLRYVKGTVYVGRAITVAGALLACRNEYVPAADTNEVPPAMDRDMGATVNAPDSTTGVSDRVMRPTISGDTAARSTGTVSPTPILRDTGQPQVDPPR